MGTQSIGIEQIGIKRAKAKVGPSFSWSSYWASLISATVEQADQDAVVLTFPTAKTSLVASDFTIAGFTISSASWTGTALTLVLSTVVTYGDSLIVTFVKTGETHAITNNITHPLDIEDGDTVLWNLHDDLTTITKDASNLISQHDVKLASGHNLLQATDGGKPVWLRHGILYNAKFMKASTFAFEQPEVIYMVIKPLSWTSSKYFFDGNANNTGMVQQFGTTPNIRAYAGSAGSEDSGLVLHKWGIMRVVFDGAASKLQINGNAATVNSLGISDMAGFALGGQSNNSAWGNFMVKDTILRISADGETAIYNYLKAKNIKNITGNVCIIGDSVIAAYSTYIAISASLTISGTLTDVSTAGETIAEQKTRWDAIAAGTKTAMNYVFVQIGLNDLDPAESAVTAIGRLQVLINAINTDAPSAKVIIGTLTPCKQRLIDVYGAVPGATAYQKWLDINIAIRGGANAVTGTDEYIDTHTDDMNDGSGNLAALFDSGDHVHENNIGRAIISDAWLTKI